MTFKRAVDETPGLKGAYRAGLGALPAVARPRIGCNDTRPLSGSVDLDTALEQAQPQAHRWDYGIAYRVNGSRESVNWVGVHPATDKEVAVVLLKLQWLLQWLSGDGHRLGQLTPRAFVWISSGRTAFTRNSPKLRALATKGVRHVGDRLLLPG
jgi:hypothetical protein